MKYLLPFALIGVFLVGCADTPLKQADIEDRAMATSASKYDVSASLVKQPIDSAAASTTGAPISDISAKTLAAGADKPTQVSGVETRGVSLQSPKGMTLSGAAAGGGAESAAADAGAGAKAESADALKYVAQPVLDPKNPQSPLAQRRLLFDYDSSAIRDEYRTLLEMHAQYLKNEKTAKMLLQGHADERGSREYNLALGQRRADSVFQALNLLGVPAAQIEAVSLGEEKPVAEGHDESAWAQNRRAEILYQDE